MLKIDFFYQNKIYVFQLDNNNCYALFRNYCLFKYFTNIDSYPILLDSNKLKDENILYIMLKLLVFLILVFNYLVLMKI